MSGGFPSLDAMIGIWQAASILLLSVTMAQAADASKPWVWHPPITTPAVFTSALGMLDAERDEYASNLASLAANQLVAATATTQALEGTRRMLALALHLSHTTGARWW